HVGRPRVSLHGDGSAAESRGARRAPDHRPLLPRLRRGTRERHGRSKDAQRGRVDSPRRLRSRAAETEQAMTTLLLEFAIRTALIAGGTAAVLRLLQITTASVRHAAWSAVVVAMLVLPMPLAAGVRLSLPVLAPAATGATRLEPATATLS